MTMRDEDPNFTGSSKQFVAKERVLVRYPVDINIAVNHCYSNGKITRTYYDWSVTMAGRDVIARWDSMSGKYPKTRKAAITAAKRAVKAHCEWLATRADS